MTDYTLLITSEHQQPNFTATVALTANAMADISALVASMRGLFDLDVAIGNQLDIVGQWIGIGRQVAGVLTVQFFGFADDSSALTFGELTDPSVGGRFYELGDSSSGSAILQDPEYRIIMRAKIIANDYGGTIGELETAVADVIGYPCIFIDPGTRVVFIIVSQTLDPVIQALLAGYDILPRPAGVRYQLVFPLMGYSWTTVGTATAVGTTVSKPSGVAGFDSSAYVASPVNHIFLQWTVPDATHDMMGGLSSNPSGSPNYPSLNYGLRCFGGIIFIYEAGVQKFPPSGGGNFGGYLPGDTFAVYFDGSGAVYLHNGAVIKTTAGSAGSFAPMFCLDAVGAQAQNIVIYTG